VGAALVSQSLGRLLINDVCFWGQSRHRKFAVSCLLMTHLRHPPLRSLCSSAIVLTPAPIGTIATSEYDFREGQPFAIAPRGEAACHSSSVSFTSFRATQG
jgi:hypothetical protein